MNGNYGPWSPWTLCSKSCAGGVRSRIRNCTNPVPEYGGKDCSALGEPQESEPCNTKKICPGRKFFLHLFYFFIKEHVINVDKDSALEKRPQECGFKK